VHPLNLVGSCADVSCTKASPFFRFIQVFYNFVSLENRWQLFTHSLRNLYPKSQSGTGCSARSDATRALKENYETVYSFRVCTAAKNIETVHEHSNACTLANKMKKYELAILGIVWNTVLVRFNVKKKILTKETTEISKIVELYGDLVAFVGSFWSE
jgi:hypothetical protein